MTAQPSNGYTAENREGYTAYTKGRPFTANPYPWEGAQKECIEWAAGYAAARTDKARANRRGKK